MGEKPSFWTTLPGILTGVAGLITAIITLYTTLHQAPNRPGQSGAGPAAVSPPPETRNQAGSGQDRKVSGGTASRNPNHPDGPAPKASSLSDLFGSWQASGEFQDGRPYFGRVDLGEDSRFNMSYQGVTTAQGVWRYDPEQRSLVLDGQHILYGSPISFRCNLTAPGARLESFRGSCTDATGTGTLRLIH